MAVSANEITPLRSSANHRASSKYQFGISCQQRITELFYAGTYELPNGEDHDSIKVVLSFKKRIMLKIFADQNFGMRKFLYVGFDYYDKDRLVKTSKAGLQNDVHWSMLPHVDRIIHE